MHTLNTSPNTPALPLVIGKITIEPPQNASSTLAFATVEFTLSGFHFTIANIQIRLGVGRVLYAGQPQHPFNIVNGDRIWRKTALIDPRLWTPISAAILAQWQDEQSQAQNTSQPLTPRGAFESQVSRG